MQPNNFGLQRDDIVEMSYPARFVVSCAHQRYERWVRARVIDCTPDTWPLVRLDDGQSTEIRRFMRWRLVARAVQSHSGSEAA